MGSTEEFGRRSLEAQMRTSDVAQEGDHFPERVSRNEGAATGSAPGLIIQFVVVACLSLPMLYAAATTITPTQDWKDWRNVVFGPLYALLRFVVGYWLLPPSFNWKHNVVAHAQHDLIPLAAGVLSLLVLGSTGVRSLLRSRSTETIAPGIPVASFVLLSAVLPTLLLMAVSPFRIVMSERYVVSALPFFWLLLALGLGELWRSRRWRLMLIGALGLLVAVVGGAVRSLTDPLVGHEDWKAVAKVIADSATVGDQVWVHRGFMIPSLNRYLANPRTVDVVPAERALVSPDHPTSVFLVLSHVDQPDTLEATLRTTYVEDWSILFPKESGIWVFRFSQRRSKDAQPGR